MENNNSTYFPDVKTIIGHLKNLKGVDPKELKKNMHTLEGVAPYIIQFYKTSGEMAATIEAQSNSFSKNTIDTQKFMLESLTKIIESINKFNELKIPYMLPLQIRLWKFKKEVNKIAEIFLGRGGIVRKLSAFNIIRAGGIHEEYDEDGNIVSKTKVDPLKPADVVKALEDVVDVIIGINNKTAELAGGVFSSYILFNAMWPRLINTGDRKKQPGVLNRYVNLIKSKEFKYLEKEDISSYVEVINNNIESINTIIETITKIDKGTLKKTIAAANVVDDVIENIKIVIIKISDFGTFIKSKKFAGIKPQINTIKSIIDGILILVGEIAILALVFVPLVLAAPLAIATFGIATLIVWTMAKFSTLIIKIFNSKIGVSVYQGLLLMIALVGVMVIVAGALISLGYIGGVFFADGLWKDALGMFAVAGLVTLAIAGLGYLITLMLPGIAAFTVGVVLVTTAIAAMLLIGVELLALAQFNFNENQRAAIKASTAAIIGAAKDVMDAVFNGTNEDDINRYDGGTFGRFFRSIFKGTAFMMEALTASFTLVMTTISVTMMLLIAYELEVLTKFNIDRGAVLGSVNSIMGTANSVVDAIFQPAEDKNTPGGSGFIGAIGHFFTGVVDIIELIVSIGKVALTMVAIGMVMLLAFELKGIAKIQFNPDEVVNNVNQIMGAADACIRAIFAPGADIDQTNNSNQNKFLGFIKNTLGGIGDVIESVLGIGKLAPMMVAMGMISFLANIIKSINDIAKDVDKKTVLDNTDLVLGITDEIIKKVFTKDSEYDIDKKKLKSFNALTDSLGGFVKVFNADMTKVEKGTNKMIEFVDKINTVKIENLRTATNMFEKMADFSKSINGNFEGLADVIEEKIMPLLEKLNETFENTGKSIEGTAAAPMSTQVTPASPIPTQAAPITAAPIPTQAAPITAPQTKTDYTSAISEIRQELSKIHEVLTDGSQVTRVDDR